MIARVDWHCTPELLETPGHWTQNPSTIAAHATQMLGPMVNNANEEEVCFTATYLLNRPRALMANFDIMPPYCFEQEDID